MNSTFLRVLALMLVVGAITTAWIGYRISTKSPTDAVKVVTPTYSQVVAAQAIPLGKIITVDDVELTSTTQPVSRSYKNVHEVLGKLTMEPIAKGSPLTAQYFPALGALAQSLAPDERAIAVKVNEVIGVGGFVKPGDRVDVLLYLRADRETDNVSSAQIVLRDVKVLAYGEIINEPASTVTEDSASEFGGAKLSDSTKKSETKKEKDSRSAILAVPDNDVSRLMLAESSGTLRLALRGAQPLAGKSANHENQFIRLNEVAKPVSTQVASANMVSPGNEKTSEPQKKNVLNLNKRQRVIVHHGEKIEEVSVAR